MTLRVLRIGGVHEPFNLPWIRAFEHDAFRQLGVEVVFETFAGGTGALVDALESHAVDLATVLTEGGVTAICRGSDIKLHSAFTNSPLRWGVHVSGKATQTKVSDLKGKKFAISRFGSGSELMAWVLADDQGWKLKPSQFVVVGGVDGAITALPKRKAHIFMWERFVTAPLVRQGIFKRVGELSTPWPAFQLAARPGLLASDRALIDDVTDIALMHAAELKTDVDGTIEEIVNRYGMNRRDARSWLTSVEWPTSTHVDHDALQSAMDRMAELDRIDAAVPIADLL